MPGPLRRRYAATVPLVLALTALVVAGCGDDDDKDKSSKAPDEPTKATTMSITTTDIGKKQFKMEAPKSIEGGLVTVNFRNASKVKHEAQLIRLDGGHTVKEVLKIVSVEKPVIPDWFQAEGGVAGTEPGQTGTATVKLPPGDYAVIDTESGDMEGPPPSAFGATANFKVTGDNGGVFKDTPAKIAVKDKGHHEYEWVTSNLKAGKTELTFDNTKSKEIHLVVGFPILGNATIADVRKFLSQRGKPSGPPPVDFEKGFNTAVLDGKRKETTTVTLVKGRNALVCFLHDRDGKGKPHTEEGLLKEVEVQ